RPQLHPPLSSYKGRYFMMTPRKRLRSRRGGSGWDAGLGPLGRPCAPTSGLSEGCPHHPRTGASPALRLHELGGLIRRRVGLTLAVNLGVGRGPLKLVPIGDPLRSPLRRGLIPNTLCQLPTSIAYISPYTSISRSFVILLKC